MFKIEIEKAVQIIQLFCRIGSPQEIRSPNINLRKFKRKQRKVHLNQVEHTEYLWMTENLDLSNFKIEIQKGGPNN